MPSRGTFQLTAEQLALQAARKARKENKPPPQLGTVVSPENNRILQREWLSTQISETLGNDRLSVMTWNMLAQSLVRRDLFPGSDALKFADRGPMLSGEILTYNADILCLQEVDRLDVLLPAIESRYSHVYACGRKKEHGCMVLFKSDLFELQSSKKVYYDEEDIRQGTLGDEASSTIWRRGTSRVTKNIALIVALKLKGSSEKGFIVATTHLFWHPAYVYERSKQVGVLLRSLSEFRRQEGLTHWPCFIAGDFNLTPDDATYSLMVGEAITAVQEKVYNASRVVHVSIDPTVPKSHEPKPHEEPEKEEEEDGGEEAEEKDPDRVITNSRPCIPSDGLLDIEELKDLYGESGMTPLRSLYDEFLTLSPDASIETVNARLTNLEGKKGGNEPVYTSYTHFWKSTLDYIFLLPPQGLEANVEAILRPHKTEDMGGGLPKKQVCGSDHISLAAKVIF